MKVDLDKVFEVACKKYHGENIQIWDTAKIKDAEPENPGGGWWVQAWVWVPAMDVINVNEDEGEDR